MSHESTDKTCRSLRPTHCSMGRVGTRGVRRRECIPHALLHLGCQHDHAGRTSDFDNSQMGVLMSAFMLGYFLFQIPGGWTGNSLRHTSRICGDCRLLVAVQCVDSRCVCIGNAVGIAVYAWGVSSRYDPSVCQDRQGLDSAVPSRYEQLNHRCLDVTRWSIHNSCSSGWLLGQGFGWRSIFAAYSLVAIVWALGLCMVLSHKSASDHTLCQ